MADDAAQPQQVSAPVQAVPLTVNPQYNILDQTLGELLQNNPQAQQMITSQMGVSREKFQQMLTAAQQNNLMHMKIGDLFKNGIIQQAQGVIMQGQPVQLNQQMQNAQPSDKVPYALPDNAPKKPWWKRLLGL